MKIKGQTRKLAAGCSKQVTDRTEDTVLSVVDRTDEVSSKHVGGG
ncbi:hypothetical protein [Streptococcus pneumoniae]|nr:hypothetical protein [Streptococcus pneumoniae]